MDLNCYSKELKMRQYKVLIVCVIALVDLGIVRAAPTTTNGIGNTAVLLSKRAHEYWADLKDLTAEGLELLDEKSNLPAKSLIWHDQRNQDEEIAENRERCRRLLLPDETEDLLEKYRKINQKIVSLRGRISDLNFGKGFSEPADKTEAKKQKIQNKISELEKVRLGILGEISLHLKENAGISLEGEQLESFLNMISAEVLIDNTIVAREIQKILLQLQNNMKEVKDVEVARRYYGMYLVLVDTILQATEGVEAKIRTDWIPRLDSHIEDTMRIRNAAVEGARMDEDHRKGYQVHKDVNETMIQALRLYRETLVDEATKCRVSIERLKKERAFVKSAYDTVAIAGNILSLFRESQDALHNLASLQLPDFDMTGCVNVREQFQGITRNLIERKIREKDFGTVK